MHWLGACTAIREQIIPVYPTAGGGRSASHPIGLSSGAVPQRGNRPASIQHGRALGNRRLSYGPAKPDSGQAYVGPRLVVAPPDPLQVRPLTASFLPRTAEAPRLCDRDGPMRSCPRFPVTDLQAALVRMPVIGILRGCPPQYVDDMVTAAEDAGLTALEVTLDSREPFDAVRSLVESHPRMTVGARTVRSVREVAQAVRREHGSSSHLTSTRMWSLRPRRPGWFRCLVPPPRPRCGEPQGAEPSW